MIPRILFPNLTRCSPTVHSAKRSLCKSSQQPRIEKKHYRLWAVPGDLVLAREILAKQFTMNWHPGLNAGINEDRSIYSLCDGVMIITEEEFKPDWRHPIVNYVYRTKDDKEVAPAWKRYIHVIPKKRVSEFKLVDVV